MIRRIGNRIRLLGKALVNARLDALEMLAADHFKVNVLLLQLRATRKKKERQALFRRIRESLDAHMSLEESVFYPTCEKIEELSDTISESFEEHRQVKSVLTEMSRHLRAKSPTKFDAAAEVLMEDIRHHVREEEEGLFPRIRKLMDRSQLEDLRMRMVDYREKLPRAA